MAPEIGTTELHSIPVDEKLLTDRRLQFFTNPVHSRFWTINQVRYLLLKKFLKFLMRTNACICKSTEHVASLH